jgi:hypothetical protein
MCCIFEGRLPLGIKRPYDVRRQRNDNGQIKIIQMNVCKESL